MHVPALQGSTSNIVNRLNFRVRNGYGCFPVPMAADKIIGKKEYLKLVGTRVRLASSIASHSSVLKTA